MILIQSGTNMLIIFPQFAFGIHAIGGTMLEKNHSPIIGNYYHPNVEYVGRDSRIPQAYPAPPGSWVPIYAKINDKYGKIEQAILSYRTRLLLKNNKQQIQPWNHTTMRLIDGSPSNGTYAAIIPPQIKNTTVYYFVYFKDDLNYTYNSASCVPRWLNATYFWVNCPESITYSYFVADHTIGAPLEFIHDEMKVYSPVFVRALLVNYDHQIRNVTLYYMITKDNSAPTILNFHVEMKPTPSPIAYISYYEAKIPIPARLIHEKKTLWLFSNVTWSDYEGNTGSQTNSPRFINSTDVSGIKNFNKISLNATTSNLDMSNLTAKTEIRVGGYVNTSLFTSPIAGNLSMTVPYPSSPFWRGMKVAPSPIPAETLLMLQYPVPFLIANVDNNLVKDYSISLVQAREDNRGISHILGNMSSASVSFSLRGDPSSFPFDHYFLNLLFIFPLKNIKFNSATFFDKIVNSTWDIAYNNVSSSNINEFINQYHNIDCQIPINNETLCGIIHNQPVAPYQLFRYLTYLNTHIEFKRNYSISNIVLPIFSIFYLLGAVFIFKNSDISNRLVLTLGVFALIFSLPSIINSMKPTTSVPTIADSLLSIIVFATIAFTISSVISSSSVVQKRFPRHYSWIDGLLFILVSIIVISLLRNYDPSITIWLIPVLLLGLGYGLLIRISKTEIESITLSTKPK